MNVRRKCHLESSRFSATCFLRASCGSPRTAAAPRAAGRPPAARRTAAASARPPRCRRRGRGSPSSAGPARPRPTSPSSETRELAVVDLRRLARVAEIALGVVRVVQPPVGHRRPRHARVEDVRAGAAPRAPPDTRRRTSRGSPPGPGPAGTRSASACSASTWSASATPAKSPATAFSHAGRAPRRAAAVRHHHREALVGEPLRDQVRVVRGVHPLAVRPAVRIHQHRQRAVALPVAGRQQHRGRDAARARPASAAAGRSATGRLGVRSDPRRPRAPSAQHPGRRARPVQHRGRQHRRAAAPHRGVHARLRGDPDRAPRRPVPPGSTWTSPVSGSAAARRPTPPAGCRPRPRPAPPAGAARGPVSACRPTSSTRAPVHVRDPHQPPVRQSSAGTPGNRSSHVRVFLDGHRRGPRRSPGPPPGTPARAGPGPAPAAAAARPPTSAPRARYGYRSRSHATSRRVPSRPSRASVTSALACPPTDRPPRPAPAPGSPGSRDPPALHRRLVHPRASSASLSGDHQKPRMRPISSAATNSASPHVTSPSVGVRLRPAAAVARRPSAVPPPAARRPPRTPPTGRPGTAAGRPTGPGTATSRGPSAASAAAAEPATNSRPDSANAALSPRRPPRRPPRPPSPPGCARAGPAPAAVSSSLAPAQQRAAGSATTRSALPSPPAVQHPQHLLPVGARRATAGRPPALPARRDGERPRCPEGEPLGPRVLARE